MPVRAGRPDLNAFMEAYATLNVEYGAGPLDVRKAFKLKVREHHPDRFPAGSPEQRHATEQMAAVARAQRQAAFSRAITVALSVLGVVFYVFWYAARPAWLPTGPVIGTALLWLAYLLAGQTRTGLVLWRTLDLFRMVRPTLGELNRLE